MNKQQTVTWGVFKQKLLQNPSLDLQFQYAADKWVAPSYHITEIKQAPITSVDCGGVKNDFRFVECRFLSRFLYFLPDLCKK